MAEIQERHDAVRDLERKLIDLQQVCLFTWIELLCLLICVDFATILKQILPNLPFCKPFLSTPPL